MNEDKRANRYIRNIDSAKAVASKLFAGAQLRGCDPNWSFSIPYYMPQVWGSTFDLPDTVMGTLAEHLGLPWKWGKGIWSHPDEQKAKFEARAKHINESELELKRLMKKQGLTKAMRAWEKVERCSQ